MPDLVSIIDDKYRVVRANKAMAARLGVTPEECVGLTCYRVVHGTDEPPSFCPHRQLLKDELEHTKEVHENGLGGNFVVSVSPLHDSEGKLVGCIHVARDINERKEAEEALRQSEQRVRMKLESILSPDKEIANLELADIFNVQAIQSLMDDFYKLAHIPIGIIDLKGNVLVGVGWQDICTKFHRAHPETLQALCGKRHRVIRRCSSGRAKDVQVQKQHVGHSDPNHRGRSACWKYFPGSVLFEGESLDYEFFRSQARQYGFNEEEYIAALEKVPRFSPSVVDRIMTFFMKFANMLSQLGYSNIRLAKSLAERNTLLEALQESEEKYRNIVETANEGVWIFNSVSETTYVNEKMAEMLGYGREEMVGSFIWDYADDEDKGFFQVKLANRKQGIDEVYELKLKRKEGSYVWLLVSAKAFFDKDGKFAGSLGMFTDINERKRAEEALKKAHDSLEEKVKERTTQLEKAYNSLKESEEGLAEAQKMAHIGNWEWVIATDKAYWSDELYRIFERKPPELAPSYNEYLNYIHPDDRNYFDNVAKEAMKGKPYNIDHRIVLADGEERAVHIQSNVIFDERNTPIRVKGIVQDITERKRAEENVQTLGKYCGRTPSQVLS